MGAKYPGVSVTSFNNSPPADDGTQSASNLITWAGIKTKLADPVKTGIEAVNTALVAAFDYSVRQISSSDSLVAGDHMRTVEIAPTTSPAITVTLPDAATMTNVYRAYIKNSSAFACTITRATVSDTCEGVAADFKIPPLTSFLVGVNSAASGYLILGSAGVAGVDELLSSVSGTNTITGGGAITAYKSGQRFTLVPANTNTGATTLNIGSLGAKNVFAYGAACVGGELVASQPYLVEYDGTQFNILNPGAKVKIQVFTGNGTYTPTTGMKYCRVTVIGSGGAGGGAAATGASQGAAGFGGGAGGAAIKIVSAATVGASQTVTVGAAGTPGAAGNVSGGTGNTSSFGSIASATGGAGGPGGPIQGNPTASNVGNPAGGTGSSGDLNIAGEGGGPGYVFTGTNVVVTGKGGNSILGGGATVVVTQTSVSGQNAGNYGAGGTGGANGASQSAVAGGTGGGGVVFVEEFF